MCTAQRYIMQLSIFEIIQFIRKRSSKYIYFLLYVAYVCQEQFNTEIYNDFQLQCEINNFLFTRKYLKT